MGKLTAPTTLDAFRLDQPQFDVATIPVGDEAGSGIEAIGARDLWLPEVGVGVELALLLVERIRADSGTGVDFIIAFLSISEKFGTDVGVGVDISAPLKALFTQLDSGVGVEAILSRALGRPDTGLGVDAKIALLAELIRADTAIGADLAFNIFNLFDTGVGVDISSLLATSIKSDSGVGVDAKVAFLATLLRADIGVGADLALKSMGCFDSGIGTDTAILLVAFTRSDSGVGFDLSYMALLPLKTRELVAVMPSYNFTTTMRKYDLITEMRKN